jgi:hypothetical protein
VVEGVHVVITIKPVHDGRGIVYTTPRFKEDGMKTAEVHRENVNPVKDEFKKAVGKEKFKLFWYLVLMYFMTFLMYLCEAFVKAGDPKTDIFDD